MVTIERTQKCFCFYTRSIQLNSVHSKQFVVVVASLFLFSTSLNRVYGDISIVLSFSCITSLTFVLMTQPLRTSLISFHCLFEKKIDTNFSILRVEPFRMLNFMILEMLLSPSILPYFLFLSCELNMANMFDAHSINRRAVMKVINSGCTFYS